MGVLSEALHSFLDLISASISFVTVRHAIKPADDDHPFGHGKFETLSSLFEALLLTAAAVWIVVEGIQHLQQPQPIQHQNLAMATIFISMVLSYYVYKNNLEAAEETESTALHVNALHFLADVVASGGVLIGLVVMTATGWTIVDPIIAFVVAAYIFVISLQQVKKALLELTDSHLPEDEVSRIRDILDDFKGQKQMIEAHDLRTRKGGATRHVDFHMGVCGHLSVRRSHDICDQIEQKICETYPGTSVNIHVEPCEVEHIGCSHHCPYSPPPEDRAKKYRVEE